MPGAVALGYESGKGYDIFPLFVSDSSGSWNELETTNFIDEKPVVNGAAGETMSSLPLAVALSRKVDAKQQKIIILGDADCLSNSEIYKSRRDFKSSNSVLANGIFHWMSDGEVPIDVSRPRPTDDKFYLSLDGVFIAKIIFMGVLPGLLAIAGIFIWVRRKSR